MKWQVVFSPKSVAKSAKKLSPQVRVKLATLLEELKAEGPVQAEWSHYGQLFGQKGQKPGERRYHCHLQGGRQTMVACWRVWRDTIIVEVYYVGSHGKAPY